MEQTGGTASGSSSKSKSRAAGRASGGSWLEAIARAMGEVLGEKAAKMVELSNKLADLSAQERIGARQLEKKYSTDGRAFDVSKLSDKQLARYSTEKTAADQRNAREMNAVNAELTGTGQLYSVLQQGFSSTIKSIGEAMSQMARKARLFCGFSATATKPSLSYLEQTMGALKRSILVCVVLSAASSAFSHSLFPPPPVAVDVQIFDLMRLQTGRHLLMESQIRAAQMGSQMASEIARTYPSDDDQSDVKTRDRDRNPSASVGISSATKVARAGVSAVPRKIAAQYPSNARREAETLFRELLEKYPELMRKLGVPPNDLASSVSIFLTSSFMAYRNVDVPDEYFKPLVAQMRQIIGSNPKVAKASDADKQEVHEQMAILGMFMGGTHLALKEKPNAQVAANMKQAAKRYLEQFLQTDADRVQITAKGLVLK